MAEQIAARGTRPPAAFVGGIGIAIVVVAALAMSALARDLPVGLDQGWHDFLATHRFPEVDAVARFLNVVGGTLAMTIVTAVIAVGVALRRNFRAAISVALAVAAASAASSLIKMAVARPRPPDGMVAAASGSFPSGHTTTAAALTIALWIAFPHVWSRVLAAAWIPLMAASRNYLLVHWLSDVIGGAVLGASVALVVTAIVRAVAVRILKEPSPDRAPITGRP
jgi:membrane-associated phospholipid phosphatase